MSDDSLEATMKAMRAQFADLGAPPPPLEYSSKPCDQRVLATNRRRPRPSQWENKGSNLDNLSTGNFLVSSGHDKYQPRHFMKIKRHCFSMMHALCLHVTAAWRRRRGRKLGASRPLPRRCTSFCRRRQNSSLGRSRLHGSRAAGGGCLASRAGPSPRGAAGPPSEGGAAWPDPRAPPGEVSELCRLTRLSGKFTSIAKGC